jgi:flagellar biogenesis protein FliO
MNRLPLRTVVVALVLAQRGAWAQSDVQQGDPWALAALLGQALLSLAVIVGLIYLVYFGIRRIGARELDASAEGPMRIVQARHLGGDRWLYLVEIDGRRLVVGGADGQVAPIADLGPRDRAGRGGERRDEA